MDEMDDGVVHLVQVIEIGSHQMRRTSLIGLVITIALIAGSAMPTSSYAARYAAWTCVELVKANGSFMNSGCTAAGAGLYEFAWLPLGIVGPACLFINKEQGEFTEFTCMNKDPTKKSHWELAKVTTINSLSVFARWALSHVAGGGRLIKCEGTSEGKVETEGKSEVETMSVSSCKTTEGTCGTPSAKALNLPWTGTLSEPVSKEVREELTGSGGGPGWEITCHETSGERKIVCTASKSSAEITDTEKDYEAEFDENTPETTCTEKCPNMSSKGTVRGTMEFEPTSKEVEKGIERVESEPGSEGT
jgi:hypothetical protein